jgi:hypothetical protein
MKTKAYVGVLAAVACLLMVGCKNTASEPAEEEQETPDTLAVLDSTEWVGVCGDGTSMNALELVSGKDTLYISLVEARDADRVYGGLEVGDSVYVWLRPDNDSQEEQTAEVVVNLHDLEGSWVGARNDGSDCAFVIGKNHEVNIGYGEHKEYNAWYIRRGQLVLLTTDEEKQKEPNAIRFFDLQLLYSDSLLLKSGTDSWRMGRK